MKIMKKETLSMVALATLLMGQSASAAPALVELNYDENNGSAQVANSAGGGNYAVHFYAGKHQPERVPGVSRNALRTDGYSTWVTGSLTMPATSQMALSTWIALESYPSTEEGAAK